MIESINEFNKLKELQFLTHLVLSDSKIPATNPVCEKQANYKNQIVSILNKLEYIDGIFPVLLKKFYQIISFSILYFRRIIKDN